MTRPLPKLPCSTEAQARKEAYEVLLTAFNRSRAEIAAMRPVVEAACSVFDGSAPGKANKFFNKLARLGDEVSVYRLWNTRSKGGKP